MTDKVAFALDDFPVVGIGASAGGLEAFIALLQALPPDTGMAFVVVQHLDPHHDSILGEMLAKATVMPVTEVTAEVRVQPNHVYVIAPNTALTLSAEGMLRVEARLAQSLHLPIDQFFASLAASRPQGAIGVVLSGSGSDGSAGLLEIKAAGGVAIAQDEASAKFASMPLAALHTGSVDLVLPPARIAGELARIGRHPYLAIPIQQTQVATSNVTVDEKGFRAIVVILREASGVDFGAYRDTTIKRRIARRVMLHAGDDLESYAKRLRTDRRERDALYQDILINVTKFFREPELFDTLKERVFPSILANKRGDTPIRIWVPGCSTGQEAYSLGMALIEFLDDQAHRPPIQIFATDLSEEVSLQGARNGLYPASIEADVSAERLRRFFQIEENHYRVSKALREIVVFARQNVAIDPPFSHLDMVSCRNLLIYLGPALQRRVIPTFHYALNPGGFLVLGASETIGSHTDLFTPVNQAQRIYGRKATSGARPYPHFRAEDQQARQLDGSEAIVRPRDLPADWHREADRVAAGLYVPPGVLINDNFDILQFRGQTGSFLSPAPGEPSNNLLKMAREGLFVAVRAAVMECKRIVAPVRHPDVRIRGEGVDRDVDLHVMPVTLPLAGEHCYLVLFEEKLKRVMPNGSVASEPASKADDGEAHRLRQELAATREYLQSMLEQQDAANEQLKSANEEIQSSNEELQSTNEELETAKEELQSINEELTTVNEQLQHRNTELGHLNDDMNNLLSSSGMLTVVLGVDGRIRRFTAAAGKLLGLLAGDVGRPLGQLKTAVELPETVALVAQVMRDEHAIEREVHGADGKSFQMCIHPYRTADNRIDGAVLVLFDVDELRKVQSELREERDYARAIVETVRESLLVLDGQFRVLSANAAFYATFRVAPNDTVGRVVFDLGNGQWNIPELHERLATSLAGGAEVIDFEVRHEFETLDSK